MIVNNCKHYILNEEGLSKIFFINSFFLVEVDIDIIHPFGVVYKPKNIIDTPIRFVRQRNNSFFMFKANEWKNESNPFYKQKSVMAKVGNKINSVMNREWAKHVRRYLKKATSGLRRLNDKRVIREELKNGTSD